VGTAVRSLSCATDGSMVVAANNSGTCYVWRLQRGSSGSTTHFEPFHKLAAHNAYILKCLISPDGRCVRCAQSVDDYSCPSEWVGGGLCVKLQQLLCDQAAEARTRAAALEHAKRN